MNGMQGDETGSGVMKSYEEAVWSWFLPQAWMPSVYGGKNELRTREVMVHLEECGIDYARSDTPNVGSFEQFCDTFSENDLIPGVVVERWRCLCGEVGSGVRVDSRSTGELVIKGDFEIGRIIWEVVQNGLRQEAGSRDN